MRPFDPFKVPTPEGDFRFVLGLKLPFVVEIGCGVGKHPLSWAASNLDSHIVAIEKTNEKFRKFKNNFDKLGQPANLFPVHADAVLWVSKFVKEETILKYFILYPNPYPKEKQKNLRFHNMPFINFLVKTLVIGGEIVWATNIKSQFDEARESFNTLEGLVEKESGEYTGIVRTHFEKKYKERGDRLYQIIMQRQS